MTGGHMKKTAKCSVGDFLVPLGSSIRSAMKRLSEIGEKELFVVDDARRLAGALSDGDIRKWLLHGGSIDASVDKVCNRGPKSVGIDFDLEQVKRLMLELKIESVPVIDGERKVGRILVWDEVFGGGLKAPKSRIRLPIVIMAGGKGTRLDPFTRILPKPLIPIGDKPVIELIMDKFVEYGIQEFFVSLNHKARMVRSYFEDAKRAFRLHYVV